LFPPGTNRANDSSQAARPAAALRRRGLRWWRPASPAPSPRRRATPALGFDRRNLDTSVRPQDDFFRYVNGGWLKTTQIPADRSSFGSFVELRDRSEESLRAIIEEAAAARNAQPGSETQKVGDLYPSFMDSARVEAAGVAPLRPELARIAALRGRAQLPETFARLQRMGVQTPFSFGVGQDPRQATRYIGSVGQSGLGLPDRDYYLKDDAKLAAARTAYQTYVETLLRLAGDANPAAGARAVVALERQLAEKQWDRARSRDREASYNLRTVAQLDSMTPGFAWGAFLRAASSERTPGVVVRQPDYLVAMNRILGATPVPVIRQYLTVKLLDSFAPVLSTPFASAQFAFRGRALQGLEANRPRWKRGVSAVEGSLGEVAGKLYVERNFQPESRARMERLVGNLRSAFREAIDSLEWMSPETRAQAQAKLQRFNVKIGYPSQWRDYSALEIRPGDLAGNMMRTAEFQHNRMTRRLGQPIDRNEWGMTPQTVNAYYSPSMNEIVFPAAILQPPFFDPNATTPSTTAPSGP
jgi:predicted metalloendopeptidase